YVAGPPFGPTSPLDLEMVEKAARDVLDEAIECAHAAQLSTPITRRLVHGSASGALIEASTGADLLIVGSRGMGGFTGLLLGSVSHQVAHHAHCPVVIVAQPR